VSADQSRYGYQEYRTFASYSPGRWRFSLDALTQQYKEKISDARDSYQVVGSAGWQVYPYLSVSGDLTYTKSPRFSYDYAGLLRVSVDLGFSTGGQGKGAPSGSGAAGAAAAVSPEKSAVDPVVAYLDRMAAEIRAKLPDAVLNRRGEGMEVTLPSDLLFDSGSAGVKPGAMQSLATAAGIFNRFPDTLITVEGHTDSTGTAAGNQELSEKRARSVFTVLVRNGVHALRISMRGYGDRFPVADNAKPDGQRSNRRVQMKIRPDENLKARQSQGR
jgi:outer membrane protein OmpA-like peptidoglycan-associated protein